VTAVPPAEGGAEVAARVERRWAILSIVIVLLLASAAALAGLYHATMPQMRVETIDPATLHLGGEFVEGNLGSAVEADGSVTVRLIGQQYSFVPDCLLVPGYVSSIPFRFSRPGEHLMPCQEYCGVGHEGMWARVKVVDRAAFERLSAGKRRVTCADQ
jgi:cytochrome c oxidase subunit 2